MDYFVYSNKAFAIHEINIQTDGVLSTEQLGRWSGVKREQNLFALDLARVKRDLELIPSVASVSVERVLPHTLRIRAIRTRAGGADSDGDPSLLPGCRGRGHAAARSAAPIHSATTG